VVLLVMGPGTVYLVSREFAQCSRLGVCAGMCRAAFVCHVHVLVNPSILIPL